jgi:hypothetical protein
MQRDDSNDSEKELGLIDEVLGKKNKLEIPSSNFTHRVMMNLHSMPVATSLSPKNGLFLLGGTMVAVTILTFLVSGGTFDSMNETINLPQLKQSVPVNGTWVMKGLIILNIVLAFALFDRTILRPFFNKRATR